MAQNYVEIRVKASDTAKPDLDALRFQLDELGAKVETARVDVDDKDAAAKLLDLNARLADLSRKVANPRITAAGAARVEAQLAAIDLGLDKLNDKHAKPEVTLKGAAEVLAEVAALDHELDKLDDKAKRAGPGGLLGKIISGIGGGSIPDALPMVGGMPLPALAAIVPVAGALATELTGLVSGFAAAGAGAGAFALLAAPAVKSVETAYTGLSAAQKKYQDAQDKEAADPSKAHAKAVHDAAVNLKLAQDAIGKLPKSEKDAVGGLQHLFDAFHKLSKAFEPTAFKVFNNALDIANKLLPDVTPLATTFAGALDGLLTKASKFASSKGFKDWLKQFQGIEGPAITAIGNGIGNVATSIGKLLTTMSGKDVAATINIAFGAVAGVINGVTGTVKLMMNTWDGAMVDLKIDGHDIASAFDSVRHTMATHGHDIAQIFDNIRHAIADFAHNIAAHFDEIRHDVAHWVDNVTSKAGEIITWFGKLPGRIISAVGNLTKTLWQKGVDLVNGFIHGIESMFGSIASTAQKMVDSLGSKVLKVLGISSPSRVAHWWGQMVAQGLADGIRDHAHLPADAAARMAAAVSSGMGGLAGVPGWGQLAGGGGGRPQVTLEIAGGSGLDGLLLTWMRQQVRIKGGGDVQVALGAGR